MELASKVALITGSSRGIGRATALKLAGLGASIVVNGYGYPTVAAEVEETAVAVRALGSQALGIVADVGQPQEVARLVQQSIAQFGKIDILVNNAGITRDNLLLRLSEEDWDQVININLKGAFLCCREVARSMIRQRWGRIINISSIIGLVGNAGQTNYSAAKAGLIGLTKSLAKELASRSITVNALAPGFIETDMTARLGDKVRQELLRQIPVGYLGSPEDVAEAVAFLASERARYITGQVLRVDGGLVMV